MRNQDLYCILNFWGRAKTREWSVENGFNVAALETVSWNLFEVNIYSSVHGISPEKWFCLKVNDFVFGCLIR